MSCIDLAATVSRSPDTASRRVAGEMVIVTPLKGNILTVNEAGAHIWERLADRPTVAGLIESLCTEFQVDAPRARADVTAFLDTLLAKGLAQVRS